MVVSLNELIPHQIGLARPQIQRMVKGLPINLSYHQMGSGAGDVVVMLHPHNAKKLLGSYKKGKGIRLHLSPEELEHSVEHGRGIKDIAYKTWGVVKSALKNPAVKAAAKTGISAGSTAVGTALGTAIGNPAAGMLLGSALGAAANSVLDSGDINAGVKELKKRGRTEGKAFAIDALQKEVHKLPSQYQGVATTALKYADEERMPTKAELAKEARANITAVPPQYRGAVNTVLDTIDTHGVHQLGEGVGKGSKAMKLKMAKIRAMKGTGGKNSRQQAHHHPQSDMIMSGSGIHNDHIMNGGKLSKIGQAFNKAFNPSKNNVVSGLKTAAHYLIPATTGALGGVAGSFLGGPVGGVLGSAGGSYLGTQLDKSIGVGVRKRGRPKKGTGATDSQAYKQAMYYNPTTYGITLDNETTDNQPISKFRVNPKVKPSSDEMTLSPYQSINSPAMNPFIPTNYQQEGGTSAGYGEAKPYGNMYGYGTKKGMMRHTARRAYEGTGTKKGMMRHTARRAYEGEGLYGAGLYGGGLGGP
jgi:hypothetical protein